MSAREDEGALAERMLCGASNGEDEQGFLIVCVLDEYHVGGHEWCSEPDIEDFKILTDLFWDACETGDPYCMGNPEQAARDLLASDWLTEHTARLVARALRQAADEMPMWRQNEVAASAWLRDRSEAIKPTQRAETRDEADARFAREYPGVHAAFHAFNEQRCKSISPSGLCCDLDAHENQVHENDETGIRWSE